MLQPYGPFKERLLASAPTLPVKQLSVADCLLQQVRRQERLTPATWAVICDAARKADWIACPALATNTPETKWNGRLLVLLMYAPRFHPRVYFDCLSWRQLLPMHPQVDAGGRPVPALWLGLYLRPQSQSLRPSRVYLLFQGDTTYKPSLKRGIGFVWWNVWRGTVLRRLTIDWKPSLMLHCWELCECMDEDTVVPISILCTLSNVAQELELSSLMQQP